jgi:hypothetical protein
MSSRPERLTVAMIEKTVRHPSANPDTVRRIHGKALLALARQPEILAKHRSMWPLTTIDDLFDDLRVEAAGKARLGRSGSVAVLALVGAFDPPNLLLAAAANRQPRREAQP